MVLARLALFTISILVFSSWLPRSQPIRVHVWRHRFCQLGFLLWPVVFSITVICGPLFFSLLTTGFLLQLAGFGITISRFYGSLVALSAVYDSASDLVRSFFQKN